MAHVLSRPVWLSDDVEWKGKNHCNKNLNRFRAKLEAIHGSQAQHPTRYRTYKVSPWGRVDRSVMEAIQWLSKEAGKLKFLAGLYINWVIIKKEGNLHSNYMKAKVYKSMLRALARGPRGLYDLRVEREILSKALLAEFFEKFTTDNIFDHEAYYHLSFSYMMPLFEQDAETVVAAMRRCVTDRFEDQLLHFVRLRLRAAPQQNGSDLFSETEVKSLAGKMFTRLVHGRALSTRDAAEMDRRRVQKEAILSTFQSVSRLLRPIIREARRIQWRGKPSTSMIKRLLSKKEQLHRFIHIQFQFSLAFEGARASLVDIYRDTAQDDDLFDLDEDSVAYLEQLSDTDDERDILEASRQHVRQARIAALPTANRKSKHAFLLAPLFKAKPVFLLITQSVLCILFRFLHKEMDDVENLLDTMWWWKLIMVVDGMTIGGGRFQCVKSRRRFRNRLRRLQCVATDMAKWESALRSENPNIRCPWLISGFSSNGYELNIHAKTVRRGKDRSGEGAEDANLIDRLPGHAETYKRAYSYCPCLNWDGASPLPAGIYKDLKRQVEDGHGAHLFADQLILCIDPGKINILSWILFRVCTDLSIEPVDYGFVEGTAYQRHMPQFGQYELWRRTMNEEYSTAIEEMKTYTKKTVHLETFEGYMHASIRFYPVFAQESAMQERCQRLFIGKIQRRQQMDKLARLICNRCDPHLILFGRSSVRDCKGHPPCSTKGLIRAFGRLKPVIAVDEFRTSSACYKCAHAEHARTARLERVMETSEAAAIADEGSNGHPLLSMTTSDRRIEACTHCGATYLHDEISCWNILAVGIAMLTGQDRPAYLSRGRVEAQVHAMIAED